MRLTLLPSLGRVRAFDPAACLVGAWAIAALAACGDRPNPPVAPTTAAQAQPQMTYDPWKAKADADRATITRTTETFETLRGRRVSKGRRGKVSQVGREVAGIKRGDRTPTVARKPDATGAVDLPPAGLTLIARRGALGKGVAWRNRHPLAGVPGVEVEVQGIGDAPAQTLRYFRNGALERTVTQSYRRRGDRWELVQRETTLPDGSFRDVVDVSWRGGPPTAPDPFRSDSTAPDAWLDDPFSALQQDCDPCKSLREARDAAFESFLYQDSAAILVCVFTPPPGDILACALAAIKVVEAWSKFTKADNAYDRCMADPPKCPDEPEPPPPPSGGGGGGGGGDGGGGTCYYEVWYDAETGEVIASYLLYCVSN